MVNSEVLIQVCYVYHLSENSLCFLTANVVLPICKTDMK